MLKKEQAIFSIAFSKKVQSLRTIPSAMLMYPPKLPSIFVVLLHLPTLAVCRMIAIHLKRAARPCWASCHTAEPPGTALAHCDRNVPDPSIAHIDPAVRNFPHDHRN